MSITFTPRSTIATLVEGCAVVQVFFIGAEYGKGNIGYGAGIMLAVAANFITLVVSAAIRTMKGKPIRFVIGRMTEKE